MPLRFGRNVPMGVKFLPEKVALHDGRGRCGRLQDHVSNVCDMMNNNILSIRTTQYWFNRFKSSMFKLDNYNHPRSKGSLEEDTDILK